MKAGEPCRLCGEIVTEANMNQRRLRKQERRKATYEMKQRQGVRRKGRREFDYDHIVKLHQDGHTIREIEMLLGCTRTPIVRALKKWKPVPGTMPKGKH